MNDESPTELGKLHFFPSYCDLYSIISNHFFPHASYYCKAERKRKRGGA